MVRDGKALSGNVDLRHGFRALYLLNPRAWPRILLSCRLGRRQDLTACKGTHSVGSSGYYTYLERSHNARERKNNYFFPPGKTKKGLSVAISALML